jgi:hypothetical protein
MKRVMAVWLLALIVAGAAGMATYQYALNARLAREEAARITAEQEAARLAADQLSKDVGAVMARFVDDLRGQVNAYKIERKILKELVDVKTFIDADYIHENEILMEEAADVLRKRIEAIFASFTNTESALMKTLEGKPEDMGKSYLADWQALKAKESQRYIEYFKAEDEQISAYQALMAFYQLHADRMEINLSSGAALLPTPEEQAEEMRLRAALSLTDQGSDASNVPQDP